MMPVMEKSAEKSAGDIVDIKLSIPSASNQNTLLRRDCESALKDLTERAVFAASFENKGPYNLFLAVEDNRLIFRIKDSFQKDLPSLVLSLKPYARLIKDYFMIVHSYDEALKNGGPSRLEAIDAGRRGLHNEGATLLLERLEGKIAMDHDTARRLFTLICVLSSNMMRTYR